MSAHSSSTVEVLGSRPQTPTGTARRPGLGRATALGFALATLTVAGRIALAPTPASGRIIAARQAAWQPWTWSFEKVGEFKKGDIVAVWGADTGGGGVHIVASRLSANLQLAHWHATNAGGTWMTVEDIQSNAVRIPHWGAVDVTADGVPHLLVGSQWEGDNAEQQIAVDEWVFDADARSDPWKATPVLKQATNFVGELQGFEGMLDVGPDGANPQGLFGYWGTCVALTKKNGKWTSRSLVKGSVWLNRAFAVDSSQRPHVLCGPKYYFQRGAEWVDEIVPGLKDTAAAYLALDDRDQPAIAAFEPSEPRLMTLYRRSDAGWSRIDVPLPGTIGSLGSRVLSFRITADDQPEVVFRAELREDGATPTPSTVPDPLHFLVFDGLQWHAQEVDVRAAAGLPTEYAVWVEDLFVDATGARHAVVGVQRCPASGVNCDPEQLWYARIDDHLGAPPAATDTPTPIAATDLPPTPSATSAPNTPTAPAPTAPPVRPTAIEPTEPPTDPTDAAPPRLPTAALYLPVLHRGR